MKRSKTIQLRAVIGAITAAVVASNAEINFRRLRFARNGAAGAARKGASNIAFGLSQHEIPNRAPALIIAITLERLIACSSNRNPASIGSDASESGRSITE